MTSLSWFGHWQTWVLLVLTWLSLGVVVGGLFVAIARVEESVALTRRDRKVTCTAITALMFLGLLLLALWLGGCGFAEWRDRTLRDVAEGRLDLSVSKIPPAGNGPSQSIEFRNNAGRTLGYSRVQGGRVGQ